MAVPGFQDLMLPFLQVCEDEQERSILEISAIVTQKLNLSDVDVQEMMTSRQTKLYNRLAWVKSYLGKACLISFPSRGKSKITPRGLALLSEHLQLINIKTLKQYPKFIKFQTKNNKIEQHEQSINRALEEDIEFATPEEQLENSYQKLRDELSSDLLETILRNSPSFFEQLVVDLLVAMGYGGSRKDAGQALGRTGDGGIDGIIKEDKLGLDLIYLQAKRYNADNVVPSREIRDFTGSLEGHGAHKGVFITTSSFTRDGIDFVKRLQQKKIVLIDGVRLTQLMIDNDIGVSTVSTYAIKKVNSDYFEIE